MQRAICKHAQVHKVELSMIISQTRRLAAQDQDQDQDEDGDQPVVDQVVAMQVTRLVLTATCGPLDRWPGLANTP